MLGHLLKPVHDVCRHPHATPALGGINEDREQQRQPAGLRGEARDDFGAALAFAEQPLQEIGCADLDPMRKGKREHGQAFLQVPFQALHRLGERLPVLGDKRAPEGEPLRIRPRRERLEDELFEQRARDLGKLGQDVAHPMDLAALHQGARVLVPEGLAYAGIAVDNGEQRIGESSGFHLLQECLPAGGTLLIADGEMQEDLPAVPEHPIGAQHRNLPCVLGTQAQVDAVEEQVMRR